MEPELATLERQIDYSFQDKNLLEKALTHRSFGHEYAAKNRVEVFDNERLEFLGDAVLELLISEFLMEACPEKTEGELSRLRAAVVNEGSLAEVARRIGLPQYLRLGKGEELSAGREKSSILADSYEALIAAIYRDGGFGAVRGVVQNHFGELLREVNALDKGFDFKTRFQEIAQKNFKTVPVYQVLNEVGPDHQKTFHVAVALNGEVMALGSGGSKKEAEQLAASIAIKGLEVHGI